MLSESWGTGAELRGALFYLPECLLLLEVKGLASNDWNVVDDVDGGAVAVFGLLPAHDVLAVAEVSSVCSAQRAVPHSNKL